ncbi:MAG TPA: hypothetical protein VMA30_05705 [Xanthobacteraceae bacterium]|nr:hypothetical protein [Xanthobacteraceae bacterium]
MFEKIRTACGQMRDFVAGLTRPPEFTCGDCERFPHCGLPPDEDCLEKAMQRERDPDGWILRAKRRAPYMLQSLGPI